MLCSGCRGLPGTEVPSNSDRVVRSVSVSILQSTRSLGRARAVGLRKGLGGERWLAGLWLARSPPAPAACPARSHRWQRLPLLAG